MGGPSQHPIVTTTEAWVRQHEKKMLHEERRPHINKASDVMGPGLGPNAVEISDWQGPETEFNGYFWSRPGALNSPDGTKFWLGQNISQVEGYGIQEVWDYRGTADPLARKSRRFSLSGGTRVFSAWA